MPRERNETRNPLLQVGCDADRIRIVVAQKQATFDEKFLGVQELQWFGHAWGLFDANVELGAPHLSHAHRNAVGTPYAGTWIAIVDVSQNTQALVEREVLDNEIVLTASINVREESTFSSTDNDGEFELTEVTPHGGAACLPKDDHSGRRCSRAVAKVITNAGGLAVAATEGDKVCMLLVPSVIHELIVRWEGSVVSPPTASPNMALFTRSGVDGDGSLPCVLSNSTKYAWKLTICIAHIHSSESGADVDLRSAAARLGSLTSGTRISRLCGEL